MYSVVFIFIFVFILGMPVWVPSGLSLALSLCWWPCGWQCHGSPGKATGYSSERRRKKWSFHPHCATVLHSQFIQLAMALYLSFTFQSLIFKISTNWYTHQYIYSAFFNSEIHCFHLRHSLVWGPAPRRRPGACLAGACCGASVCRRGKSCAVKPALRSRLKFSDIHIFYDIISYLLSKLFGKCFGDVKSHSVLYPRVSMCLQVGRFKAFGRLSGLSFMPPAWSPQAHSWALHAWPFRVDAVFLTVRTFCIDVLYDSGFCMKSKCGPRSWKIWIWKASQRLKERRADKHFRVECRRVELSCVKGVKMCQLLQATERLARPFHREPKALPRRARVQRRGA